MKKYKVTPTRKGVKAPYFIVEVEKSRDEESSAIIACKKLTSLSRFASWYFQAEEI